MSNPLADGTKITFQPGKCVNHLVPVFIPRDTVPAMKLLADKQARLGPGVLNSNNYILLNHQKIIALDGIAWTMFVKSFLSPTRKILMELAIDIVSVL